jgi:hypothetical protein
MAIISFLFYFITTRTNKNIWILLIWQSNENFACYKEVSNQIKGQSQSGNIYIYKLFCMRRNKAELTGHYVKE